MVYKAWDTLDKRSVAIKQITLAAQLCDVPGYLHTHDLERRPVRISDFLAESSFLQISHYCVEVIYSRLVIKLRLFSSLFLYLIILMTRYTMDKINIDIL